MKIVPSLIEVKLGKDNIISNKFFLSIILSICLIIYCYQSDVTGIKSSAQWGVFGIMLFLFLVVFDLIYSSQQEIIYDYSDLNFINTSGGLNDIISCISCIILSFSFHTYTFSIYECLLEQNHKTMMITTSIGVFISMFIYLLVGGIGYILYVNIVDEYYVLNYEHDTILNYLQNFAYILNVIMSFPLTFFSLRHYFTFLVRILATLVSERFCSKNKAIHETQSENSQDLKANHSNSLNDHVKSNEKIRNLTNLEKVYDKNKNFSSIELKSKNFK